MTSQKFCFVATDDKEERRAKYLLLLEKAKSIYFASQNQLAPTLMVYPHSPHPPRIFDLVTKETYLSENTRFCPSALWGKGAHHWLRGVVKFFYDNKGDRFSLDLAALYFGKLRSPPARPDGLLTPECKKLQVYEIITALAAIKLLKRHSDGSFQWSSIEECANFLGDRAAAAEARPADPRTFQGFLQALIALLKGKREVPVAQLPQLFSEEIPRTHRRPFFPRRLALALKLLSFLGFCRVAPNAKKQRAVAFLSGANVRNAIVGFLQNAHYTAKADKKELKEKFDLICLKSEAEKLVDKQKLLKESGPLFKPRTASFDLSAIDRFMQKNQNIVVPHTTLTLKRRSRRKESVHN